MIKLGDIVVQIGCNNLLVVESLFRFNFYLHSQWLMKKMNVLAPCSSSTDQQSTQAGPNKKSCYLT